MAKVMVVPFNEIRFASMFIESRTYMINVDRVVGRGDIEKDTNTRFTFKEEAFDIIYRVANSAFSTTPFRKTMLFAMDRIIILDHVFHPLRE